MQKFNDGKRIDDVVNRKPCKRHTANEGEPCWDIYPDTRNAEKTRAACGARIRAAGFVGTISETAVQIKRKAAHEFKKEVRA